MPKPLSSPGKALGHDTTTSNSTLTLDNGDFTLFEDSDGNAIVLAAHDGARLFLDGFDSSLGIDEISANGYSDVAICGTSHGDTLDFTSTTLTDIDWIAGGGGNDTIYGSAGNDYILGQEGQDHLYGNAGNDVLIGGDGRDVLDGGAGDDTLEGRDGADTLTGGEGSDTFVYNFVSHGGDTVTDFQTGVGGDTLDLSAISSNDISIEQNGSDAVIVVAMADGSTVDLVTLNNVDASTWDDTNWIL